jgi:membrane protein
MGFRRSYEAFDRYQQGHRVSGFVLAVRQKYSDDQGGYLAATITYYGFFAVFPLLLVLVSALGFFLKGHAHLQRTIINSALGQFPVIGRELKIGALHGSTLALALGIFTAVWAGMGVFLAAENAMNLLWGIPFSRRPDFFRARGRAVLLLVVLGGGALATAALGSVGTVGAHLGVAWKIASIILATALNFGLFWVGFRLLTTRNVSWRDVRGGALAAAILYELLQLVGGYYVGHVLKRAGNTYGTFGLVIGLLSWIYLAAHITLLAAEGNVVATRRLWPRSFSLILEQPSTAPDRRALRQRSQIEERRQDQEITVSFDPDDTDTQSAAEPSQGASAKESPVPPARESG